MSETSRYRIIQARSEFHTALREALGEVAQAGCRDLFLCDEDFADWPLNDPALVELLTRWAMSHRRLTLLAQTFDGVVRSYPRFVAWRRQWSHIVDARALEEAEPGEVPTLLLAPGVVSLRLFDRVHVRGSLSRDPADDIRDRELLDAIWQRATEAFPATTLGL
jgi:hypothetical protein